MGECGSLTVDPGCLDKSPQLQSSELKLLINKCHKFKLRPGQNTCEQKKPSINKSVQVCPRRCALSSDKGRQKPYLDVLFFDFQRKGGLEAAQLPPAGPNLPLRVLRTVRLLTNVQSKYGQLQHQLLQSPYGAGMLHHLRFRLKKIRTTVHSSCILSQSCPITAFAMSFCEKSCHSIHSIHWKLLIAKLPNVPCVQALMPAGPGQIRFGHQPRVGVQIFVPPVPPKLRGFINFGLNW